MLRIAQASKAIGVSPTTLRRWVKAGLVPLIRTPKNRFYWTESQLQAIRRQMGDDLPPTAYPEAPG